jgi:hypothetical protein
MVVTETALSAGNPLLGEGETGGARNEPYSVPKVGTSTLVRLGLLVLRELHFARSVESSGWAPFN